MKLNNKKSKKRRHLRFSIIATIIIGIAIVFAFATYKDYQVKANAQSDSFVFTAVGDYGSGSRGITGMKKVKSLNPSFHIALGDLGYGTTNAEATAWSNSVKNIVGTDFPWQIVAGNHDKTNIDAYIQALPNKISTMQGTYGKEYYFDYPETNPIARFIFASPGDDVLAWPYDKDSDHYKFTETAIDDARFRNISWIIVSTHKVCISTWGQNCVPTNLKWLDFYNMLISKKVDLILHGHVHANQRSNQLALNANCTGLSNLAYNSNCVVKTGSVFNKDQGTVVVISGTGGVGLDAPNPNIKSTVKYFNKYNQSTYGIMKYIVSPNQIRADFVPFSTGTFTDSFVITKPAPLPNDLILAQPYQLINACSSKVLQVASSSTANGAYLQQGTPTGKTNQQWKIAATTDGYFTLTAVHSGKRAHVKGGSLTAKTKLYQWLDSQTYEQQKWSIVSTGDGYYKLIAKHSGMVMEVANSSLLSGATVWQNTYTDSCSQKWSFRNP